jgi:hypothetical protein
MQSSRRIVPFAYLLGTVYEGIRKLLCDREEYKVDRFLKAILETFVELDPEQQGLRPKDTYYSVCKKLGASEEDALNNQVVCPYTGVLLSKANLQGRIRSLIEEHSPHSRQFYFRAGKRTTWTDEPNRCLFVNWDLEAKNTQINWMPYETVRGGRWVLDPKAAAKYTRPSEEVIQSAVSMYKRVGMRGTNHTKLVKNSTFVQHNLSCTKVLYAGAAVAVAGGVVYVAS